MSEVNGIPVSHKTGAFLLRIQGKFIRMNDAIPSNSAAFQPLPYATRDLGLGSTAEV